MPLDQQAETARHQLTEGAQLDQLAKSETHSQQLAGKQLKKLQQAGNEQQEADRREKSGRYSRQERFAPIGREGQTLLGQKHVLIVGAGALGSANAESLVRSGVGTVSIVDRDYVEWSNLQRQQLYTEEDARMRMPKAVAAQQHLQQINSDVAVHAHVMDVTASNIQELVQGVDLIVDAGDNWGVRYLINDIAEQERIPWIYGACLGSYGITYTIIPGKTPCLACIMGRNAASDEDGTSNGSATEQANANATCDLEGIIPSAVQMVVSHQTSEALKLLTGRTDALRGKLLSFDLWENQFTTIQVDRMKRPDCPSCGEHPSYPYLQVANHEKAAVLCGRDTVHIRPARVKRLDIMQLSQQLKLLKHPHEANPHLISIRLDGQRIVLFADGRALVHGTNDISRAKSIYHQFVE